MRVLLVCGKHQYGVPDRGEGTEYVAFKGALEALGHDVHHFDSWSRSEYRDYAQLNTSLLCEVDRFEPDVMLTVQRDYELWSETLEAIRRRGVATASWTTDDTWKYPQVSRFIASHYDAITTTYPRRIKDYMRDGHDNVLLTQWAANSADLRDPVASERCRYAVSFVGAANRHRRRFIEAVRRQGIEVQCFGFGWPAGSVDANRIPGVFHESVVSLNLSAGVTAERQIKARMFEVPGAGGFLLTQRAPGQERYFVENRECVAFDDVNEMVAKARYYLAHPRERDLIAMAGFQRTKQEHTYERRLSAVLSAAVGRRERRSESPADTIVRGVDVEPHRLTTPLKILQWALVRSGRGIWGPERGTRAARRLLFEMSWRLMGARTFSSSGLPGRLFAPGDVVRE